MFIPTFVSPQPSFVHWSPTVTASILYLVTPVLAVTLLVTYTALAPILHQFTLELADILPVTFAACNFVMLKHPAYVLGGVRCLVASALQPPAAFQV